MVIALRFWQQRYSTVGNVRTGLAPEKGKKNPRKLPVFRFTSPARNLIEAVAQLYGGEVNAWRHPTRGNQWEVITQTNSLPVYVTRQRIDPWFELWGENETRIRRCDGDREQNRNVPCLCDPDGVMERDDPDRLCKIVIRVSVMLADIPGIGSWVLDSHGWNAVDEIGQISHAIAQLPVGAFWPATMILAKRSANAIMLDGAGNEKLTPRQFYVPTLVLGELTLRQIAGGSASVMDALNPSEPRQALEAAPMAPNELAAKLIERIQKSQTRDEMIAIRNAINEAGMGNMEILTSAWRDQAQSIVAREQVQPDEAREPEPEPDPESEPESEPDRIETYTRIMLAAGRKNMTTSQVHELINSRSGRPVGETDGFVLLSVAQALEE